MKIELWVVGKTNKSYLDEGISIYLKRIKRYLPFQIEVIPDIKNAKTLPSDQLKKKEGERILAKLTQGDFLILLDEKGKEYSSVQFARFLEKNLQLTHRRLVFCIGGAFGFSPAVYQKANKKLSFSKMTFSHQLIRMLFVEQFYRAMTILRNEPYHNE